MRMRPPRDRPGAAGQGLRETRLPIGARPREVAWSAADSRRGRCDEPGIAPSVCLCWLRRTGAASRRSADVRSHGGGVVMSDSHGPIQLFAPFFRTDEVLEEIRDCLERGWTGAGYKTTEFEEAWRNYSGLPNAHFVNSGTAALHAAFGVLKRLC